MYKKVFKYLWFDTSNVSTLILMLSTKISSFESFAKVLLTQLLTCMVAAEGQTDMELEIVIQISET